MSMKQALETKNEKLIREYLRTLDKQTIINLFVEQYFKNSVLEVTIKTEQKKNLELKSANARLENYIIKHISTRLF